LLLPFTKFQYKAKNKIEPVI
jgi:hypothetical protein